MRQIRQERKKKKQPSVSHSYVHEMSLGPGGATQHSRRNVLKDTKSGSLSVPKCWFMLQVWRPFPCQLRMNTAEGTVQGNCFICGIMQTKKRLGSTRKAYGSVWKNVARPPVLFKVVLKFKVSPGERSFRLLHKQLQR